jgi:hypothetical protein
MPRRIKLPKPSEGMNRAFATIAEDVSGWPGVSTRLMFGMRAMYREGVVFGMIPEKRSFKVVDGIAHKVGGKWVAFEVKGEEGIREALMVLEKAYEAVRK